MITTGLIHNLPASSKLVATFASSPFNESTCVARLIADQIDGLDTYTWNTIIRGYLEEKKPIEAILVYSHVRKKGLKIDSYTLSYVTKACGGVILGKFEGKQIHSEVIKMGFLSEMFIVTSLVNMYGLFDDLDSAQRVFDETPQRDLAFCNSLVSMYSQRKFSHEALSVLRFMVKECVRPNEVTAVSVLSACSCLRALREGKQVHCYVVKNLVSLDVFVYNALMDMYSKCGCLVSAHKLFYRMPVRNVISWTTMINGYSDNDKPGKALALFKEMDSQDVKPDEITILSVVSMCSKLGSFELCKWIDHYIEKNRIKENKVCISNALMDMHAKCGNIRKACQIFNQMEEKTLVSWTTIIQGLARHGQGIHALTRFCQMQREGFRPDDILFFSILTACSHAGLVDEGCKLFQSMTEDYNVIPRLMHYGCMVDLLCRAGLIEKAFRFVEDMPIAPDVIIWRMLLGACRDQCNASLANEIMDHLRNLEPEFSGNYVLVSNLYANLGEWNKVEDVRTEMRLEGVSKQEPGYSLIEVT
ncbi:hypothetical protein AQUCO_00200538v1 [Aquilegia coerulea]|uniref:Pentacotripeptide-repeat region of PRORP domain-containing protein n=1 Tax=Aquilegia coerulea TaxID=218851 RepID=A0A2G5F3K4_AQUCA|nr:hypothetical protein AQUCO_00200538v1 [Aquilegia coerulea]